MVRDAITQTPDLLEITVHLRPDPVQWHPAIGAGNTWPMQRDQRRASKRCVNIFCQNTKLSVGMTVAVALLRAAARRNSLRGSYPPAGLGRLSSKP